MIFHFSFSSRFSRSQEKILFLFSIYEILLSYSRSLLDFQDFEEKFLFLLSIYEILLSYSRSLLDFQDFEEKFLLSLSIVKILLYLFIFLFLWEMVYFREKYALFRFLWTLCDSPETLTGWKSEIGTDQPTDSPDICNFFDTSTIFNWHQKHTNLHFFDTNLKIEQDKSLPFFPSWKAT